MNPRPNACKAPALPLSYAPLVPRLGFEPRSRGSGPRRLPLADLGLVSDTRFELVLAGPQPAVLPLHQCAAAAGSEPTPCLPSLAASDGRLSGGGRWDSNPRPSGYEPDELPLLHAAKSAYLRPGTLRESSRTAPATSFDAPRLVSCILGRYAMRRCQLSAAIPPPVLSKGWEHFWSG